MQAQNVAPPDLICNDKFLIQSAIVPDATTEDFIMSSTVGIMKCCIRGEL